MFYIGLYVAHLQVISTFFKVKKEIIFFLLNESINNMVKSSAVFPNNLKISLDSRSFKLETFTLPEEISPDSRWSMADFYFVRPKKTTALDCRSDVVGYFARPTSVLSDMSGRSDGIGKDCNGWRLIVLVMFMLL